MNICSWVDTVDVCIDQSIPGLLQLPIVSTWLEFLFTASDIIDIICLQCSSVAPEERYTYPTKCIYTAPWKSAEFCESALVFI